MELRVLREISKLLPIAEIRDEDCGGYTIKNGRGISPVTVGQEWFRKEVSKIASIIPLDSKTTGNFREQLGLIKEKKQKDKQCIEAHGNGRLLSVKSIFTYI